jgi:hypothetical protein
MVSLVSFWDFDGCVIRANVAEYGDGPPGIGGGIVALLSLCRFEGCDVLDNVAGDGESGGIGGGVFGIFTLLFDMHECTISGNAAGPNSIDEVEGMGGGIGGGMFMGTSLLGGTVVRDSLISGNTAGSDEAYAALGGGVAFAEFMFGAGLSQLLSELGLPESEQPGEPGVLQLHLVNCTLSGNSATATEFSMGGAAWAFNEYPVGLSFCTVTDNTASVGGGVSTVMFEEQGSEPGQMPFGLVLLKNSIVAGNTALAEEGGDDLSGPVVSLLGNLIGDEEGWGDVENPEYELDGGCDDLIGVAPLLGPLTDNGGPTLTHALLPGSPALDAACDCYAVAEYLIPWDDIVIVINADQAPGNGEDFLVEFDQRGMLRPFDGDGDGEARCDIGAYEARPDIELPGLSGEASAAETRVGACSPLRVRVVNEGDAVLVIDHVEIAGGAAADFSLLKNPKGQELQHGESFDILLNFCPSSSGARKATLVIYSNDPLDDPLTLTLVGNGKERRDDEPDPAVMGMSYLRVDPLQVLPGQQVVISANVCNSGEERGSLTATLMVNGSPEQSQSIGVSGGSCKQVVFTTAKAVPGTYEVSINGMQGQFSVLAPRTVQGMIASQQQTGLGTAGLVAIIAVAATLIAALVYVFRRE